MKNDIVPIEEKEDDWSHDIGNFPIHDQLPNDKMEARKVRFKASKYIMIGDKLYRRSSTTLNLRCITDENEVQIIRQEMHDGECGNL